MRNDSSRPHRHFASRFYEPRSYTRECTHRSRFHSNTCDLYHSGVMHGGASQREKPLSSHRGQPNWVNSGAANAHPPKPLSRPAERPRSGRTGACAKKLVHRLYRVAAALSANRGTVELESKSGRLLRPCIAPLKSGFPWRPPLAAALYLGSLTMNRSKLTLPRLGRHEEGINTLLVQLRP
jgi:hypothetical protein